jgi:hypothetical protein
MCADRVNPANILDDFSKDKAIKPETTLLSVPHGKKVEYTECSSPVSYVPTTEIRQGCVVQLAQWVE